MLKVSKLSVVIDNTVIVDDISFTVSTGETLAITGPSGIGKTTLLHAICGIVRTTHGTVNIDNVDISSLPTHKRGIGLVSQTGDLFPTMTVSQNIEFGLRISRIPKADRTARVNELLQLVGLTHLAHRNVAELSGGEARRIALARALAPRPRVLLLDEPLAGLDQTTHDVLISDLARVLKQTATTAVLVTHDLSEADFLAETTFAFPHK
ncbi:MAG: ATP-binding cassette domain-containing protein [Ilumatobacteraceae bacterium]|nr:ATP-binding cassette domain-containing protein [Ilumatobacteraceae bacterium]